MVETFTAHITPFGLDRNTFVYLPDGWQTSGKRYPVVYMFDGHNLFFDSTATYGTCWGLKEYHGRPRRGHHRRARVQPRGQRPAGRVQPLRLHLAGKRHPRSGQGVSGLDGQRAETPHRREIPHAARPRQHGHRRVQHGRADEPVRRHGPQRDVQPRGLPVTVGAVSALPKSRPTSKRPSWPPARGSTSAGASARARAATRWPSTRPKRWKSPTC